MAKLQNALLATAVYVSAIALIYGFTASFPAPGKDADPAHWGAGTVGIEVISVKSDAASLGAHSGYNYFEEKGGRRMTGGGSMGRGSEQS